MRRALLILGLSRHCAALIGLTPRALVGPSSRAPATRGPRGVAGPPAHAARRRAAAPLAARVAAADLAYGPDGTAGASTEASAISGVSAASARAAWPAVASAGVVEAYAFNAAALLFVTIILALTYSVPCYNACRGALPSVGFVRTVAEALAGLKTDARFKVVQLPALLLGNALAWRRLTQGVLVSTKSPLLSDLGLDAARMGLQEYRLLTYAWVPQSLPQLVLTVSAMRWALRERKGSGPCGGRAALLLTLAAGGYGGALAHYAFADVKTQALGGVGFAAALVGARCVADLRLARAAAGTYSGAAVLDLALVVVGAAAAGTSAALTLGGAAGGALVALLVSPRIVPHVGAGAVPTSNLRDSRDATRWRRLQDGQLFDIKAPWLGPRLFVVVCLLLLSRLRIALSQLGAASCGLGPALATAYLAPGVLSGRSFVRPPTFIFGF